MEYDDEDNTVVFINVFHYHACLEIDAHLEWLSELEYGEVKI